MVFSENKAGEGEDAMRKEIYFDIISLLEGKLNKLTRNDRLVLAVAVDTLGEDFKSDIEKIVSLDQEEFILALIETVIKALKIKFPNKATQYDNYLVSQRQAKRPSLPRVSVKYKPSWLS